MPATDRQDSPFLCASSVHAWDSHFRLRESGRLRDLSIESTWQRVARAVCATEARGAEQWVARVFEAQAEWRLLLDERILAGAGGRDEAWPSDAAAVLNAAAFVSAPFTEQVRFDYDRFAQAAGLAVRCLDNVQMRVEADARGSLHVGMLGLADALVLLGKRYDSPAGRVCAARIAQALAEGCLQASVRLAAERGTTLRAADRAAAPGRLALPGIAADLARYGVRHRQLTAIGSHRRLAELANQVSDALDPFEPQSILERGTSGAAGEIYPIALAHRMRRNDAQLRPLIAQASLASQMEMRGAVQAWIDAPIAYPFRVADPQGVGAAPFWQRLASAHRLGQLAFQHA